jgi:hypothetical protein
MTDSHHFVIMLSISMGLFAMGSSVKQMFEILMIDELPERGTTTDSQIT